MSVYIKVYMAGMWPVIEMQIYIKKRYYETKSE